MPARRFGHFKFLSERAKRPMVERRKAALFKKAKELSVLCDVEIGIVVFSPTERGPIVWPSVEDTTKRFLRFLNVPETERMKKMVSHEKYLRDRVSDEGEKVKKKERVVEKKEMNMLMNQIVHGKTLMDLDARQLKGLYELAGEKMQELEKRKRELQNDGGARRQDRHHHQKHHRPTAYSGIGADGGGGSYYVPQPLAPQFGNDWNFTCGPWWTADGSVVPPAPPAPAAWFTPTMAAPPTHGGYGGEGSYLHQMLFSAAASSSSANNGGRTTHPAAASSSSNSGHNQLPCLNQLVWPYNFSSSS